MNVKTLDNERILLGVVLRFGKEPASYVLPELTAEKFVYDSAGHFGIEHEEIWQEITDCVLIDKANPTLATLIHRLPAYKTYLQSLVSDLSDYGIEEYEPELFYKLAEQVDKAGVVFRMSRYGLMLGTSVLSESDFDAAVNKVEDIDEWSSNTLGKLRSTLSMHSTGYTHISVVIDIVKERWQRQIDGEQLFLIDCGIPQIMGANLFPLGKLSIIHGLSGSGKSTFAFEYGLGVAIGIKVNGIQGCVAVNSLEMDQEDLVERLCAILAKVDVSKFLQNKITPEEHTRLLYWADFVAELPIYIDDTDMLTTSAMHYRSSGLHSSEHGPILLLISDYGELFRDDDGDNKEQKVSHVFRAQRSIAKNIGCAVLAISQSTVDKNTQLGKAYIAGPDGTRNSRGPLHAADVVCELWNAPAIKDSGRDIKPLDGYTTDHAWLFIQKYRGGKVGGGVKLGWRSDCTTFFDLSIDQNKGNEIVYVHIDKLLDKGDW